MIHPDILQAVVDDIKSTPPEVIKERMEKSKNSPFVEILNLLFEFSNSAYQQMEKEDSPKATVYPNQSKGEASLA